MIAIRCSKAILVFTKTLSSSSEVDDDPTNSQNREEVLINLSSDNDILTESSESERQSMKYTARAELSWLQEK
jgi:hypothetical protein